MNRTFDIVTYMAVFCLFLATLAGCSKVEVPGDDPSRDSASGTPISFTPERISSKAVTNDITNLQEDGIKVWGMLHSISHPDGVNVFGQSGTPVTYDSEEDAWTYSPVRYWMNGVYNFAAVYPADVEGTSYEYIDQSPDTGLPTFTVADFDVKTQEDLLVAINPDIDGASGNANNPVLLNFKHSLACVQVQLKLKEEDFYQLEVDGEGNPLKDADDNFIFKKDDNGNYIPLGYANVMRAGFNNIYSEGTLSTLEADPSSFIWVPSQSDSRNPIEFNYSNPIQLSNSLTDCFEGDGYLVMPQSLTTGGGQITIEVSINFPSIMNAPVPQVFNMPLSYAKAWEPNKRYIYQAEITQDFAIDFTIVTVTPWEEGTLGGIIVK